MKGAITKRKTLISSVLLALKVGTNDLWSIRDDSNGVDEVEVLKSMEATGTHAAVTSLCRYRKYHHGYNHDGKIRKALHCRIHSCEL